MGHASPAPHIRTFHARHGRLGPQARAALDELGPARRLARRPNPERPLVLEVGCGHGDAAIAYAEARPDHDLVAIDVHTPGVAHLLIHARRLALTNLYVELGDAVDLLRRRIQRAQLRGVHVFFPDPWPKTRHHKRRFIRPDLLDLLAEQMAPDAPLLLATDVDDYAAWARRHLDDHPAFAGGVASRPPWRPATGYEARGRDAGRAPTELAYRRTIHESRFPGGSHRADCPS